MGMWQLFAISNILNRPLFSVCPSYENYNIRHDITMKFYPKNNSESKENLVYIMWTNTNGDSTPENRFVLNHFVFLMPLTEPTVENITDDSDNILDLSIPFDETGSEMSVSIVLKLNDINQYKLIHLMLIAEILQHIFEI
jgi:hypothetical protein